MRITSVGQIVVRSRGLVSTLAVRKLIRSLPPPFMREFRKVMVSYIYSFFFLRSWLSYYENCTIRRTRLINVPLYFLSFPRLPLFLFLPFFSIVNVFYLSVFVFPTFHVMYLYKEKEQLGEILSVLFQLSPLHLTFRVRFSQSVSLLVSLFGQTFVLIN